MGAGYLDAGRWNEAGVPALYFAETASVAMLEMANYLPSPRLVPSSYRLGIFEVPEDTPTDRWPVADLPTASVMAGFDFSEPDYFLLEEERMEWVAPSGDAED